MREWLDSHKPGAPARMHLLLAACVWSTVGTILLYIGARWALVGQLASMWILLFGAVVAGGLKARFVLDRVAGRVVDRIRVRGDGRCLGGFLSWWTWGLVALMIAMGQLLRHSLLWKGLLGLIYAAVGSALLLASRNLWRAWRR